MKIPYKKINKALKREIGNVQLLPSTNRPYILRFQDDFVGKDIIEQAKRIVDRFVLTEWYDNEMRYVE